MICGVVCILQIPFFSKKTVAIKLILLKYRFPFALTRTLNRDLYQFRDAEMRDIFKKFDRNKDGFITREELQTTLEECKMRQLEIDMDDIMKKADRDGDGKLSFDDFIKACRFKPQ